ncbi:MAG: hypothetical protein FWD87_05505 [Spirochaetaceae bacterium]|nr:hypothetical protein [Spirochaetaceae bacterium]
MFLHRIIIILIAIIVVIFSALFFINRFGTNNHKIVLWTDIPEFISYIEMFNSKHDNLKIEPVFQRDPARALIRARRHPDIIIGSYLNSPQVIDNFRRVNHLFRQKINRNSFYSELLSRGARGRNQLVLPVSFNMPALMFLRENNITNFVLTNENIIEMSRAFNAGRRGDISAFSPRWNSDMLFYNAVMNNANFRANEALGISYNIDRIEESLRAVRTFINEINGGIERDIRFEEKHLFKPPEILINEQRIFFAYTTLRDFYAIRQEQRERLNFRWIGKDNMIPVCDDIIFAGIPKTASNRKGAEVFLAWLFDFHTQEKIMEIEQSRRVRTFGIGNGFSSLRAVNEQIFPRHYPRLVGHIPPANMLAFPQPLPVEWEPLKNSVIKRWLYREAGNPRTTSDLEAAIDNWYRFNP